MGFEPTASRATIWRANQLRYTHHMYYFYIINLAVEEIEKQQSTYGVWLSLARAPGLGPGGRRFESCHPDLTNMRV